MQRIDGNKLNRLSKNIDGWTDNDGKIVFIGGSNEAQSQFLSYALNEKAKLTTRCDGISVWSVNQDRVNEFLPKCLKD